MFVVGSPRYNARIAETQKRRLWMPRVPYVRAPTLPRTLRAAWIQPHCAR